MKNYPFAIILLGWIAGIWIADEFDISFHWWIRILLFLAIGIVGFFQRNQISSALIIFGFFLLSIFHTKQYNQYTPIPESMLNQPHKLLVEIKENYRSSAKFKKYKVQLLQIDTIQIPKTYVLLYWDKSFENLFYGEQIWIEASIRPNEKPKNQHQFDYRKYLARQQIHYTIYTKENYLSKITSNHILRKTTQYKAQIQENMLRNGYNKESVDILGAMLLGDRTEMNPEIEEIYRKTGVVHILSISGLHILMVYTIFFKILYPLIYLRNGKFFRILLCLIFIWLYALFVDFQPPVARSALMITIFHGATLIGRIPNVYHTLCVSAFFLLVYNPNFIYDVGFQLSYSAVFFIVWLHPIYQKCFPTHHKVLKYCRNFAGTSISAQLGTFPIAAFYFHQSSGLFLFGNALMVPASFVMIVAGILTLIFEAFQTHFWWWIWAFNSYIELCNSLMGKLAEFDFLIFDRIHFTSVQVLILLACIILFRVLTFNFKWKYLTFFIGLIVAFEFTRISTIHEKLQQEELIIFHQYKNSILGIRQGNHLDVWMENLNDTTQIHRYIIQPYLTNEKIEQYRYLSLGDSLNSHYLKKENVWIWHGKIIGLLNLNTTQIPKHIDVLWISENTQVPSQLDVKNSTQIVIDGNNYPNHLADLEAYRTYDKGAFILLP